MITNFEKVELLTSAIYSTCKLVDNSTAWTNNVSYSLLDSDTYEYYRELTEHLLSKDANLDTFISIKNEKFNWVSTNQTKVDFETANKILTDLLWTIEDLSLVYSVSN